MKFNEKLNHVIRQAGLTRQRAASEIGISLGALYNLLAGSSSPKLTTLQKIARGLNVTVWELIKDDQEK